MDGELHNNMQENVDQYSEEIKANVWNDFRSGIEHGVLVSNLTYALAKALELSEEECYNSALAGFIHDIGKLELSPYLYGRNERGFEVEEIKYMRMHSKISYDILVNYDFSEEVLDIVLCHHECFDGSGYPDNLKGDEIPIGARVLKVADEFAALISDRPYRKAFDIDTAVDIMIEDVKNADMKVFIAFQRLIHEQGMIELIQNSSLNTAALDFQTMF